jgi:hypothetical protein
VKIPELTREKEAHA